MATYQSIRYNVDYQGNAGSLMPLLTFTSDGSDATADFTSKIDSTYDEYLFIFNNIHSQSNDVNFAWNCNAVGGSGFDETITSSAWTVQHSEADATAGPETAAFASNAQQTRFQRLSQSNAANDECIGGWLRIYNPASTTFVKHFMSRSICVEESPGAHSMFVAGYINTTAAIDEFQFKMSSGEIQGGTIQMFGVH